MQNKIGGQNSGRKLKISQTLRNVFAILANFAMDCEFGNVANLAKWFANLAKWFAKLAMWFANLAMWFAKLAMRNFTKLLKFYVRQMNSVLWLANFAMPTEIAN